MESVGAGRAGCGLCLSRFRATAASPVGRVDERGGCRLSAILIDRAAGGALRAASSRRAKRKLTIRVTSAAVAAPLTAGAGNLVEDGKRMERKARTRDAPRRKRKSVAALRGAELQRLAETLEMAYRKDATTDEADYERTLKNLEAQVRDAHGTGEAAAGAVSCSSPTISSVRKRRGRPPAAERNSSRAEQQKPAVVAPQKTKGGFVVRSVVVRRRTGEGKCRLNLRSRIALKQTRQERDSKAGDDSASVGKALQDIWSDEAEKLIGVHGAGLEVGVVDWENLTRSLLSAEEESELAFMMKPTKNFEALRETLALELVREPSEDEWAAAAQVDVHTLRRYLILGKAARAKLIQHNLRLVLFQAHKFYKQNSSLSLYDLCQEGVSGLIHGVDKFDPKRGHRFSTYAIYWIRNSMLRAQTRCGSIIRSPYNIAMHKLNIKRARLDLLVELERAPTDLEVMERLGLAPERFRDILRSSVRTSSMHRKSAVTGKELVETLEDKSDQPRGRMHTSSSRDESSLRYGLDDVLNSLKPREGQVLRQRFGLDGNGERTLGEIGQNLGLSREMVRKYEACALMKMKHPTRMDYLRSYLSGA